MRRALWVLLAMASANLAVAGVFGIASAQQPAGSGVIEGHAVNESAGSTASLAGLPVSLFTFVAGVRQVPPAVGQTDPQGLVRFANLATAANISYTMFVKFQNVIYSSDEILFPPNSAVVSTTVSVYDVTTSTAALRIDQHHLIIDLDEPDHALSAVELYVLTNSGDRAIAGRPEDAAGGKPVSFRAPLPPGAVVDSIEERTLNTDVYLTPTQLLDTVPIPPGQSSLVFSYRLPIDRSTLALTIGTPYTTTSLNLLVAPGIAVRSQRLSAQGNVTAGTRPFQLFGTRDVPAGAPVTVELGGLPTPLIPLDLLQWLPLAVISIALAAALVFAGRSRKADVAARGKTSA